MELREYQIAAVESIFQYYESGKTGNPVIVLPTGAGKTIVLSSFIKEVLTRYPQESILVASHVQEILEQDLADLRAALPFISIGVYSAGLGKKQIKKVTVAGIQSLFRCKELPPFSLMIIDESHMVPASGTGMYLTTIERLRQKNPNMKCLGLTATPYRLDSGLIYGSGSDFIFSDVCFEITISELVEMGYLAPLVGKNAATQADLSKLRRRKGDFIQSEVESAMDRPELVRGAVEEMLRFGHDRKSWLVFCSGIEHAKHVEAELRDNGITAESIFGDTDKGIRKRRIQQFRNKQFRALVGCQVLTTGFNAPNVDMVAILRPTESAGLFVQICGRGTRLYPGKENCLLLCFGGNLERFGPVDQITVACYQKEDGTEELEVKSAPVKTCPQCRTVVPAPSVACLDCGFEFPPREVQHDTVASSANPLSGQPVPPRVFPVTAIDYDLHRGQNGKPSMRVTYWSGLDSVSEWWGFERADVMGLRATNWWQSRTREPGKTPTTSADAVRRAPQELKPPQVVLVRKKPGTKYDQVVGYRFEAEQLSLVG